MVTGQFPIKLRLGALSQNSITHALRHIRFTSVRQFKGLSTGLRFKLCKACTTSYSVTSALQFKGLSTGLRFKNIQTNEQTKTDMYSFFGGCEFLLSLPATMIALVL